MMRCVILYHVGYSDIHFQTPYSPVRVCLSPKT